MSAKDAYKPALIVAALVLGMALTFAGLAGMEWPSASPAAWASMRRYAVLLVVGLAGFMLLSRWRNLSPLAVGAMLAAPLALLAGSLWALVVALWFALASALLGRAMLSLIRPADGTAPPWTLALLAGMGTYGTVAGLFAHFPVNYPGPYGLALALPLLLGRRTAQALVQTVRARLTQPSDHHLLDLAIATVALIHFTVAFMPEVGHDALAMHLFIPVQLAHRQQWGFDVGYYVWAVMPTLADWIYAIGYMLAGETAARLINTGFIFLLAWLVRGIVLWAGGTKLGARWAVLLLLSTPLTYAEGASLHIESVWACFVVGGVWVTLRGLSAQGDGQHQFPPAGLLWGFALAAKAVTFTILPAMLPVFLWRLQRWLGGDMARPLAVALGLMVVAGAIPYATAWMLTGNPVFPFFNQVFLSPYYPPVNFDSSTTFGKGVAWDMLYQMVFHSGRFMECRPGAAGFQWLLLFVPAALGLLLGRQRRGLALLAVSVLAVVLTFQGVSYLRYVFPSFVLIAACVGIAWSSPPFQGRLVRPLGLAAVTLAVGLNLLFFKSGTYYGDIAPQPLLSERGREAYLQWRLPIRGAVQLVNRLNTRGSPVAFFSPPLAAGLNADALHANWYNHRFRDLIAGASTAQDAADILRTEGVEYVVLDAAWGTPRQRMLIEQATETVSDTGPVSVRVVRRTIASEAQLLGNSPPVPPPHSRNDHEL